MGKILQFSDQGSNAKCNKWSIRLVASRRSKTTSYNEVFMPKFDDWRITNQIEYTYRIASSLYTGTKRTWSTLWWKAYNLTTGPEIRCNQWLANRFCTDTWWWTHWWLATWNSTYFISAKPMLWNEPSSLLLVVELNNVCPLTTNNSER